MIIATGNPFSKATPSADARKTEVFKWQNEENSICDLPDVPIEIEGAVTVTISDTQYVCGGGYPESAQCFNLITGDKAPFNLLHKRFGASSVATNNKVYVFGGRNGTNILASYETINVNHAQSEGVLPFTFKSGCATLVNSTNILLAGGWQDGSIAAMTWLFNFEKEEWTKGPSMIEGRINFGCGLIKSINSVAVFGGHLATTEIVKLPGGSFKNGNC